jgi:hypothetical protein
MKIRATLAGTAALAVVLAVGTYAFKAHSQDGRFPPSSMHSPGMMGMGHGMMGGGMMMGMGHDQATMAQLQVIHTLLANHDRIKRTVTNLPNGIRTATESDDPTLAALIKSHVASMGQRVGAGDDPNLPIETPSVHAIFRANDKIKTSYETTDKGIVVVQTSDDAPTVAALQQHASEVTDLVHGGMAALQTAMMKNHGGMMGGGMMMHGPMMMMPGMMHRGPI